MSQLMKKRFPSITSIDVESDGNTSFLRAARNGQLDKVLEHLKSNIDINTSNANGLNALHLASKDGHVDIVEELLKRGAVVDAATKKGNTALHIASLAGQEEVVKLLVQHGASVNVQSQNGFTPLYMAAQENHDNVVKYLLANGANQSLSTEDGFTPLAVAMQQGHDKVVTVLLENDTRGKIRLPALHIAAKKDDVKAAKLLLENEHNPDVTSKSGFTPLHIASHYGNQQIANLLIQKGADVNYAAKHNITPLHVAAKWGKTNMVALLLEHGATIESKTRDGLTPLHCAARSGHEQVVDMLLERGAPISSKTKNGLAPLHMAAQGDHVDAARILLYHRAPVDEVTVDYLTALHVAAHCGHVRVAKLLLDRQADANARALNGFTPLHIACKKNRIKVVELLLKHGASIGATTESGLTPLHVASFMGCMNIVIYLLQHDANPDVPTVRGETPLHLAARANQTDIIRILLRNGAQVDARAREQQTPLHIASRLGNVDIVMLLLQHGAKVDNTTKDMYTALHIAAKEGQDEVAAVLLDHGASLDATTKKGFTPLHLAAKYGHLKVAKLLSQKEAPVDAQGKNGVTPLHVASHYDNQNVALLLLDKGASPYATAKNGHTPLHIAARKNQMDIANTLLEYGAQPNAESKAGFTPLHLSAQEGHADMSALLVEHKADANYEAKNGLTPLHLCAQEDRVPVAEILVKNGADVNAATKGGYTPLHIASHYGQTNMVRFLLQNGANVKSTTSLDYTPLHQAAQQGHANIVNILLENSADPNAVTTNGQTPLNIAQKLGYITVIETLKVVTTTTTITTTTTTNIEEKYRVQAPELMHETFMSDSEEEGGEDTVLGDQTYRYLTADEMKSLGDDSLPIDVTRDERIDSNRMVSSADSNMLPPQHIEDSISPEHVTQNYVEYIKKYIPDNVDIGRHPISIGFLVSFLVDARGGAMRGCRHSGVRVIVPPRCAPSPTRITCRYVRPQRTPHPPPLMEGEALASRVLELGPVGAKFLGPVIIEVPHFAALRGKEREIVILRSDNGESWKEHTVEATEDVLNEVLHDSFEAEDLNQLEDMSSGRITRILTQDFPQYFAVVSRIRQEVHAIGPEGGMVSSTVVPQVQAVFPEGALTKKIKVGLQAQPIDPELTAKLLGHGVAVSPVVTVEPRRRKFHKAITLSMPAPRAHSQGMINQYSGSAPTLRLLCSITGGTTRAQWEDVTGSTPLTFVNDCVSFTTTVSARFWLMDCRNIGDATKMATELYKEAIHVPFMAKFVVFAKRVDPLEARLRVFCMTDDKEDKTLEHQEHFTEVAKSRDVEVLEGKLQYVEFAGNLVPITKSGEQLSFSFRAFRENRLPFSVRVKDQHAEAVSRCLFMKEAKVPKGEPPQQPICILNIVLPDDIVTDTISLTDTDSLKKHTFLSENFDYYRPDPRLADMSNLLGEDWVPLANQLGLTTSEINVIKSEYPDSVAKQAQSMLRMWLSQSGNKAQTNTLENALRRIGREDIIPQCLNVDHTGQTITRIKQEEIGKYRLKKDIDIIDKEVVTRHDIGDERLMADKPEVKRKLDIYDKYSAEEKAIEISDEEEEEEEAFDKPVAERREQIEKRLSAERTIPASSQRREIVQEITSIKRQSIVEDKIAEVQQKATPDQKTTPEQTKTTPELTKTTHEQIKTTTSTITTTVSPEMKTVSETVEVKTTIPSDSKVSETVKVPLEKIHEVKTTIVTETRTIQPEETTHRTADDAELLEGVTQSLEKTKKPIPKLIADEDPKSPKFSKTPPPSPADFLIREQAATVQEWDASRKPAEPESKTLRQDAAQQEISCEQLTEAASPLTPAETKQLPQPKPRSAKSPETPPQFTKHSDDTKLEKPVSPVRDDLLDEYDIHESYSDKKKFWESVTKDAAPRKINLQEVTSEKESIQKRASIHEIGMAPVPKPRTILQSTQSLIDTESEIKISTKPRSSLQTSQSVDESEKDEVRRISVKDRAMSFESTTSETSGIMQTELSKISESDISPIEDRMMSEYQASFQPPTEQKPSSWKREECEKVDELQKTDSVDSDAAQKGSSQFIENSGYISDSEDVEHYISDSEIEDRVPQIRDRLMSVFVPSASSARKSIYERSASLPTEDMYEVSARNIKLRKEYYEEQIRKEMIEEQLTSEIEEEPSPEKKALLSSTEDEHTDADAKSIAEELDEDIIEEEAKTVRKLAQVFEPTTIRDEKDATEIKEEKISSVKSLTKSFEEKISTDTKAVKDLYSEYPDKYTEETQKHEKIEVTKEKTSVKDLAKGYEKQLGNVVAGQRIGQSPSELKGFILDKHAIDESRQYSKTEESPDADFMETIKSSMPDKDTYKAEDHFSVSPLTQSETHKDIEIDSHGKTFESQQSISSDKSTELVDEQNFRDDSHSTKPDSMEVLVDKSEIEDTEKLAELDQDFDGKSFDSIDAESSPKASNFEDDAIPEITVTLSGKQRRISEESDEYADKPEVKDSFSPITEKSEAESPIKVPEEHVQDTVWEVSIESHTDADFDEKVEDIIEQKSAASIIQEFIATEKVIEEKSVLPGIHFISEYSGKDTIVEERGTPLELKQATAKGDQKIDSDGASVTYQFTSEDKTKLKEFIDNEQTIREKLSGAGSITETKDDITTTKRDKIDRDEESVHLKKEISKEKEILKQTTEEEKPVTGGEKIDIKSTEKLKDSKALYADDLIQMTRDSGMDKEAKIHITKPIKEEDTYHIVDKSSLSEFTEQETIHAGKDTKFVSQSEVDIDKDDIKEMIDQQEEISEQLEAKLKQQFTEDTLEHQERKTESHVSDTEKLEKSRLQEDLRSDKVEKDDDLSSSVRDESDLGSEIHQDHSDSNESDRIKSESHSDIEKIILDSLHQQKVHPEEAKKIASALIEEIEAEIQKRDSLPMERSLQTIENVQVSEFLKNLAETKGLDEREVELVESVLARRQRGLAKLTRGDTQASSMEITDEDLKYSGTEMDYSHILEQQMDQLEAEKVNEVHIDYDHFDQEQAKRFHDKSGYVDKIDEEHSEETVTSHDFESYEDSKVRSKKKDLTIKSSDTVKGEKAVSETKEIIFEDEETISESITEESEKLATHIDTAVKETSQVKSDDKDVIESKEGLVEADIVHKSKSKTDKVELKGKDLLQEKTSEEAFDEETSVVTAKFEANLKSREISDHVLKETKTKTEEAYDEISKTEHETSKEEMIQYKKEEDGSEIETKLAIDKKHSVMSSKVSYTDRVHEETTSVSSKIIDRVEDLEELMSAGQLKIETEKYREVKPEQGEVIITHEVVKRTSSSDSKSSTDAKSPEDQFSTSSSGKREESDTKTSEKHKVIFRKTKSDADTSSSSSNLKPDRKSGIEFEAYSSSGESHYHSFEMDSGKSRPCSSDVEGLVAAGSSEYESALTSQEYSARSHMTSTEYQTAVSSMSSKESMKSLDSESSGNLASVEVSEHSETLVPTVSDIDDILDSVDQPLFDEIEPTSGWTNQGAPLRQSTEVSDSELLSYTVGESIDVSEEESSDVKVTDIQSKMKRSHEMTFQPEPKILVPESPLADFEEKLGTSLDEGSVLSVSVSSTSSTGAQRTVIELSRADSERLEGSMTVSGTSEHLSLDDVENMPRGSRESLIYTPTPHVTSDISTSTPQVQSDLPIESVTITTSVIDENGIQSVSTQVTSETQSPVEETIASITAKPEELKKKGHRRSESTSFMGSIINVSSATRSEVERRIHSDLAESDKYNTKLSFKETSSDEKKDIDESEKEESYETEADQGFHRDLREGRYLDKESDNEPDNLELLRFGKLDQDTSTSTSIAKDRPDSEPTGLAKTSDVTEEIDSTGRPISPEPCDETKDDTPEFSSEAQASVGELEQEYTSAISRSQEIQISERRSISNMSDIYLPKEPLEKRDSHGKSSSTSSEKSSFEEAEAEAAFNMVAHVSPAHKIKQICPILEDEDAEKHELETRERVQKEYEERRMQVLKDASPGFVPDIKITQHMTPLVDRNFRYPELELEAKEEKEKEHEVEVSADTPQTPASNSSKSSEETDQGREYVLDETVSSIPEEPEGLGEEKITTESKSEGGTVIEATIMEGSEKGTDSPNSDSFEMLEKPDLIDDFVVIEEVGKEAQEFDAEGKSVKIGHIPKTSKKHDEEVEQYLAHSAPTPLTRMTDIKYYPDGTSSSEELGFDFEDSPPQVEQKNAGVSTKNGTRDYGHEYDKELEANRKWIEQQFQGDQAAMMAAGYGYEMEFERGPLEDIKEEDINDFAASSYGSQRESGGSVKDSYSSTPEYDVLAGRKYFTRSAEHDDVSMSSLQEFENLEQAMSLEMRKFHQGSQDSSSNGSFKARYHASKGGQGDDISVSSLKEFEGLEKACIAAHKIEVKVKEEEALLTQIDEGQESIASESESCETGSGTEKKIVTDTDDDEDYEKRMFEIDEIIRQAQTNVERFIDLKEMEKTESLGRGDSIEEVSKVPDLDLDAPIVKSTVKVQWKEGDDVMITSTDSLDLKMEKPSHHDSTDSLDQKTGGDIMTASTDSIEFQAGQKSTKDNIMTDSIEIRGDERSYMVSSDSLELGAATSSGNNLLLSDSIDEDGSRIGGYDQSSSSTGKDFSSSAKEDDIMIDQDAKGDLMLESTESLDPTSSTATHATYQYDTDSVYSGSFTSGGSNTMVSSTNSIDQSRFATSVDVAAAVRKVWFDEDATGRRTTEYIDESSKPYVTEVIEPSEDDYYSHTIHRRVELPPEVRKVTFTGSDADEQMRQFIQDFNEGEDVQETEEIDDDGNVHVKKVVQRRFIVKSDGTGGGEQPMSGTEIEEYFKQLNQPDFVHEHGVITKTLSEGQGMISRTITDGQGSKTTITQQFDIPQTQLTTITRSVTGGEEATSSTTQQPSTSVRAQVTRRRPLRYEISIEDQTEVDPREHDWRFNLPKHAEGEEAEKEESGFERRVPDQHQLSDEMKELLKELEKESKQ